MSRNRTTPNHFGLNNKYNQNLKKILESIWEMQSRISLSCRRDSSNDWIPNSQPPTQFYHPQEFLDWGMLWLNLDQLHYPPNVFPRSVHSIWHTYTFHEKDSPQLEFMLLIAAFEKYTKNVLFAKLRETSDLCKSLPNQPGKELAEKKKKKAWYIPLELCSF